MELNGVAIRRKPARVAVALSHQPVGAVDAREWHLNLLIVRRLMWRQKDPARDRTADHVPVSPSCRSIVSAARSASAAIVRVGFAVAPVGNTPEPTTKRLCWSC